MSPPAKHAELAALAAQPDAEIDTSDAPDIADWTGAERGRFYRPIKRQLTLRLNAAEYATTYINREMRDSEMQHHTPGAPASRSQLILARKIIVLAFTVSAVAIISVLAYLADAMEMQIFYYMIPLLIISELVAGAFLYKILGKKIAESPEQAEESEPDPIVRRM